MKINFIFIFQLAVDQRKATLDHGDNASTYFTAEKNAAKAYPGFNQCVSFL